MKRRSHRPDGEVEQHGDLVGRVTQYVLEDHAATLRGLQLEKAGEGQMQGLLPRKGIFGVLRAVRGGTNDLVVQGLAHAPLVPAQMVERPTVSDLKEPGAEYRHLFDLRERVVGASECVLDDVLTVANRTGHPRAIAVQVGADGGDERQKPFAALSKRGGQSLTVSYFEAWGRPGERFHEWCLWLTNGGLGMVRSERAGRDMGIHAGPARTPWLLSTLCLTEAYERE